MLIALEIGQQKPKSLLSQIVGIGAKPKLIWQEKELFGYPYLHIWAKKPLRFSQWQRVYDAAVGEKSKILLCGAAEIPPEVPLEPFQSRAFDERVLFETACSVIDATRMQMYRRVVGLVDLQGNYHRQVQKLLHHFTAVKVLTQQPALYEKVRQACMDEMGAPVLLCTEPEAFADCVMVLCPEDFACGQKAVLPGVWLAGGKLSGIDCHVLSNLVVQPAAEIAAQIPAGINPHALFAALYQSRGATQMGFVAQRMLFDGQSMDFAQIVERLVSVFQLPFENLRHPC